MYTYIFYTLVIYYLIKACLQFMHCTRAIDYMFDQPNAIELSNKHKVTKASNWFGNLFNPLKWTYKQSYPKLVEKENE